MTVLAKFTKQPIETEFYAIQFAEDMAMSDEITGGHVVVTQLASSTGLMVLNSPYQIQLSDDKKTIRTTSNLTPPVGAPDGFTLYLGNANQNAAITFGSLPIPARACAIFVKRDGQWEVEVTGQGIVVSAPRDQRIRIQFAGGVNGTSYKAELTAITAEGRVIQDELVIKVKET